jgi:hypothetical protein
MHQLKFHKFSLWLVYAGGRGSRSLKYNMPMSRARLTAFAIMMTKSFFKRP